MPTLLAYQTDRQYGRNRYQWEVIEHLPQYDRVLANSLVSLLKPGGNIFLDGSACTVGSMSCRLLSW